MRYTRTTRGVAFAGVVALMIAGGRTIPTVDSAGAERTAKPVAVDLRPQNGDRSDAWKRSFFIPYGDSQDTVGLSAGGDTGAVAWYGPEGLAPAADGSWWVLDTANARVIRASDGRITEEYSNQPPLQMPTVAPDGSLIASTGRAVVQFGSGSAQTLVALGEMPAYGNERGPEGVPTNVDGGSQYLFPVTRSGVPVVRELALPVDSPGYVAQEWVIKGIDSPVKAGPAASFEPELDGQGSLIIGDTLTLQISRPPGAIGFNSIVETVEDQAGGIHLLWYGYWNLEGQRTSGDLAAYFYVKDGELIETFPVGALWSEHDPGSPSILQVIPGTTTPTLNLVGADGVEGWTLND